jgi:hypothetical protein
MLSSAVDKQQHKVTYIYKPVPTSCLPHTHLCGFIYIYIYTSSHVYYARKTPKSQIYNRTYFSGVCIRYFSLQEADFSLYFLYAPSAAAFKVWN